MISRSVFERWTVYLLFAVALTPLMPLFGAHTIFFPYVFGKTLFLRTIITCAFAVFALGLFTGKNGAGYGKKIRMLFRHPLAIAVGIFFAVSLASTVVAVNRYHALWGDLEWGDGLFSLLHFVLFFFLSLLLFRREDWMRFLKISLAVGGIVIIYAWLQYAGADKFPLVPAVHGRIGSFLDNAALFGTYLLFVVTFACAAYVLEKNKMLRYGFLALALLAAATLPLADVRGALIGLLAGAGVFGFIWAFWGKGTLPFGARRTSARFVAALLLLVAAAAVLGFFFTRNASVWRTVPGLGRLASITRDDPTVQTRMLALRSGWAAFRERPIFGWGLENFSVAYNAHYLPAYARYEEAWFDRAHNKFLEVLVTQGIVGFLAYLGIFGAAFFSLIRAVRRGAMAFPLAACFAGGIAAYLVQSLFLFDSPAGYAMLYALFGFLVIFGEAPTEAAEEPQQEIERGKERHIMTAYAGGVCAVALAIAWYFTGLVPIVQSVEYQRAIAKQDAAAILKAAPDFFEPYNFLQPTLRMRLLAAIDENRLLRNGTYADLVQTAIRAAEEVAEREGNYDPRNFITLARVYNELGKDNQALFQKAETYARRALELSPRRQDIFYILAFSLAGQERFDEAVETARAAVLLDSRVAKAHYFLGIHLALFGKERWNEALDEFQEALDIGFVDFLESDAANMGAIYKEMLFAYITEEDAGGVARVAKQFTKADPRYKEDMETILELAAEKDWRTLKGFLK